MRVLVTGGGGFLGRNVVEMLLARGDEVRSLGRSPQPALAARGVDVHAGDIADYAVVERAVAGCEAVIHTAAKAGIWGPPDEFNDANVTGTRNVVTAMQRQGVARLVHTSTPSVVFDGESHAGADESLPLAKVFPCHYVITKAVAERVVLAEHNGNNFRAIALRPHLIWGAGDPHLVPRLVARAHRLRIVGDGMNRVDLTHVRNAARAHILALDALAAPGHPAAGRAFFISDGAPVVLWDWINALLQRLGQPPVTRHVTLSKALTIGTVMEFLWRFLPLRGEPPMTRFLATELAKDHWYSIAAARNLLGYSPKTDLSGEMDELILSLK